MDTPIVKLRQFTVREDGCLLLLLCGRTKSEAGELDVGRGGRAQCVAMFITLIQPRLTFCRFLRIFITPSPQVVPTWSALVPRFANKKQG